MSLVARTSLLAAIATAAYDASHNLAAAAIKAVSVSNPVVPATLNAIGFAALAAPEVLANLSQYAIDLRKLSDEGFASEVAGFCTHPEHYTVQQANDIVADIERRGQQPSEYVTKTVALLVAKDARRKVEDLIGNPGNYTKDEVVTLAADLGTKVFKSWTKDKMIQTLHARFLVPALAA